MCAGHLLVSTHLPTNCRQSLFLFLGLVQQWHIDILPICGLIDPYYATTGATFFMSLFCHDT